MENKTVKIAKRVKRKTTKKKTTPQKKLTAAEKRDLKAKEKVAELLKDTPLEIDVNDNKGSDDVITKETVDDVYLNKTNSDDWLQEQVGLLTAEVETLKSELERVKSENENLVNGNVDKELIKNVTTLFNELQTNHIKMGFNQMTKQPNLTIHPIAFMNRLIMFFPFLKKMKKY